MKITGVEIFDIQLRRKPAWNPVIMRLTTDEGITGLGEAGMAFGVGHTAAASMTKDLAEAFVIGADPFKIEKMWETMFRNSTWAAGGGPVVYGGMSAIDTALWDIKGKALGVPVYQLLGGKTNDRLRTYASQIQFGWGGQENRALTEPQQYAEEALKAVAEGYDCIKVDPVLFNKKGERYATNLRIVLPNELVKLFYHRMKAVRDAVGPDVDIIVEHHAVTSVTTAIQLGRIWEEFNCMYYEEPVHYMNVALMDKVTKSLKIPMACGEKIYTRWGFRPYFEKQTMDIVQPDLGLVGGITEGKKICDYANVYDLSVQLHVCGSPVATAAALLLEAVIPNFIIHEHVPPALWRDNRKICKQDYQPVKGVFDVPELPGLGIELNDEVVSKFLSFKVP